MCQDDLVGTNLTGPGESSDMVLSICLLSEHENCQISMFMHQGNCQVVGFSIFPRVVTECIL